MRRAVRKKVFLRGIIVFQQATFKTTATTRHTCIVKNISVTGAKIDTVKLLPIPDQFSLELPDYKMSIPCLIKWRFKTELGVQFLIKPELIDRELATEEVVLSAV